MTPLEQIKKLAGNFVFNQILYPRDSFLSDSLLHQDEDINPFLDFLYRNETEKIQFAIDWCSTHPGPALDLSKTEGRLALALVKNEIETVLIENNPSKISQIRSSKEILSLQQQSLIQIYPQEITKLEMDKTFPTVFAGPPVLEQTENELAILGTLRKIMGHMTGNGCLFIEVHNLDFFENKSNFRDETWNYALAQDQKSPWGRLWERSYAGNKDSQTVFEYAVSNKLNEFSLHRSTLHLFNLDQWMKLFEVAGFLVDDCYGDWSRSPVNTQSSSLVFHLRTK